MKLCKNGQRAAVSHVPTLTVLGVRTFPFVSFSQGIFSHLLLRDNNDGYLRETKDIDKEKGEVCSGCTIVAEGVFSQEGQRYSEIWAEGKGGECSSSLSLALDIREETDCNHCGENSPPLRGSISHRLLP